MLQSTPRITGFAAVAGKNEGEGPLASEFDAVYDDELLGEKSFEKAESKLHLDAVNRALEKAHLTAGSVDAVFAGDLLNQCIGTSFALRDTNIPFFGLYGACSTMALSLMLSSILTDSGAANTCVASASSHFCSAERQYRLPLEYGGQRTPNAQWTATAAGAAVVSAASTPEAANSKIGIAAVTAGRIADLGVTDANNMGAAMAPAAAQTIADFLNDTGTKPEDYDLILTGDLGVVGKELLLRLMVSEYNIDISAVHNDGGLMLFDINKADVHAGGSGCGCSAAVVCSYICSRLQSGELKRVLFAGTGALLSPTSTLQGESIPAVAHAVLLTSV